MISFNNSYQKYAKKFAYKETRDNHDNFKKKYSYHIIIPIYNELDYIHSTLQSIEKQKTDLLNETLIILIINNNQNASSEIKDKNYKTHQLILKNKYNFEYVVLDYYSNKNAIKEKDFGVGLARKIGFDFALKYSDQNSLFFSLDADTLVSPLYLETIVQHYKKFYFSACVINFRHQQAKDTNIENGIRIYEKALHEMAIKIKQCNSPYGYISMGSTIICTAQEYLLVGGMPKKKACEDFYFMQSLAKHTQIYFIKKVLVYPSSRVEQRVHLGTGYRMNEYKKHNTFKNLFFPDSSYQIVQCIIAIAEKNYGNAYTTVNKELIKNLSDKVCNFLDKNNICKVWQQINLNAKSKQQFMLFFHQWFDALKIMQLLKYVS